MPLHVLYSVKKATSDGASIEQFAFRQATSENYLNASTNSDDLSSSFDQSIYLTPPMPACELKPADKKAYIGAVGEELVHRHGKKDYYRPENIREAACHRGYSIDYVCWAYCIFSSPADFTAIHIAAGEACDYVSMKAEVLADLAGGASAFSWIDIDLSWLQWPDIDLSSTFDWFDWNS